MRGERVRAGELRRASRRGRRTLGRRLGRRRDVPEDAAVVRVRGERGGSARRSARGTRAGRPSARGRHPRDVRDDATAETRVTRGGRAGRGRGDAMSRERRRRSRHLERRRESRVRESRVGVETAERVDVARGCFDATATSLTKPRTSSIERDRATCSSTKMNLSAEENLTRQVVEHHSRIDKTGTPHAFAASAEAGLNFGRGSERAIRPRATANARIYITSNADLRGDCQSRCPRPCKPTRGPPSCLPGRATRLPTFRSA
jgi:hypothetical protein